MSVDEKEALRIWQQLETRIKSLVREEIKACVKWKPATVIAADNVALTATVRESYCNDDGSQDYVGIPNVSGSDLTAGDSVFFAYAYSPTNAMVVYKNVVI